MSSVNTARSPQAIFWIERMTEHDLLEVVEIEEMSGLSRWGWDGYHEELGRNAETVMLVARAKHCALHDCNIEKVEKKLAGFLAARIGAGELHINNVAVRETYRQMGIGASLLKRALEEGRRRGALRAMLEVRASNIAAQALYLRQGFEITGRRKNYYAAPQDDALLMVAETRRA